MNKIQPSKPPNFFLKSEAWLGFMHKCACYNKGCSVTHSHQLKGLMRDLHTWFYKPSPTLKNKIHKYEYSHKESEDLSPLSSLAQFYILRWCTAHFPNLMWYNLYPKYTWCMINDPLFGGHWVINIMNLHFIHAGLERSQAYLSIYLSIGTCMIHLTTMCLKMSFKLIWIL